MSGQKTEGRPESLRDALILKVRDLYGVEGDHPFRTSPDAVVFRHTDNRKWFGLIMTVDYRVLAWPASGAPGQELPDEIDEAIVPEAGSFRPFIPAGMHR